MFQHHNQHTNDFFIIVINCVMISSSGMPCQSEHTSVDFPEGPVVSTLPSKVGGAGSIPELGRPPENEMTTHSSILSRRFPWTKEPGGLQSMGSQRVRWE